MGSENNVATMNLYHIDLNLLVVFDALMAEGNVSMAAARIGLSQPAMSNALGRLRKLVDDPLFVRTPMGMIPTPRARALVGPVRQALAQIAGALQEDGAFMPQHARHTFTLAATDDSELVLLPRLVERLAHEAPDIHLHILPMANAEIPQAGLAAGHVDLVLGAADELAPALHTQALFEERFVCLVRADHPEVGDTLTLEQFTTLPHVHIAGRSAMPDRLDEALAQHGLQRRVALRVPHFLAVPLIVAHTHLIATLAERVGRLVAPWLKLRVVELPIHLTPYTVRQVWHERTHYDAAHQWLRRMVATLARRV